jgi:hypothetical protein
MDSYEQLASAFVGLADTLVADYDVIELAQQLIDSSMSLLPIAAAGILVGDVQGELHVIASSSEQTRLLELLQVESDVGPCLLAYRTGKQVLVDDLDVDHYHDQYYLLNLLDLFYSLYYHLDHHDQILENGVRVHHHENGDGVYVYDVYVFFYHYLLNYFVIDYDFFV